MTAADWPGEAERAAAAIARAKRMDARRKQIAAALAGTRHGYEAALLPYQALLDASREARHADE